jgi:hypothetical protein
MDRISWDSVSGIHFTSSALSFSVPKVNEVTEVTLRITAARKLLKYDKVTLILPGFWLTNPALTYFKLASTSSSKFFREANVTVTSGPSGLSLSVIVGRDINVGESVLFTCPTSAGIHIPVLGLNDVNHDIDMKVWRSSFTQDSGIVMIGKVLNVQPVGFFFSSTSCFLYGIVFSSIDWICHFYCQFSNQILTFNRPFYGK